MAPALAAILFLTAFIAGAAVTYRELKRVDHNESSPH